MKATSVVTDTAQNNATNHAPLLSRTSERQPLPLREPRLSRPLSEMERLEAFKTELQNQIVEEVKENTKLLYNTKKKEPCKSVVIAGPPGDTRSLPTRERPTTRTGMPSAG
ncbi:hypothetical protein RIF29_19976 [Crotalaria pallida]|uniref:Uncharacterized protein n=1 Tax=Crotalaria pallida TaxID=3830 RepID=A0AAN9I5Y2_CROPI